MQLKYFLVVVVTIISVQTEGAKILAVFYTPSRSHLISGGSLLQALAKKGHEVHLLTSFFEKVEDTPTYRQELLTGIIGFFDNQTRKDTSMVSKVLDLIPSFNRVVDRFWQNEPVQRLIKTKPKYDAVIIVTFFSDFVLSLAHHLEAPSIIFSTIGSNAMVDKYVANPNLPYVSNVFLPCSINSFWGRLLTVTSNSLASLFVKFIVNPQQEIINRKYLPDTPPLDVLNNNVSLILASSHFIIESPRPYVPNMVQIGGFHIQEPKKLPKNLQIYLDSAVNGAILFSMGTMVKLKNHLDREKLDVIIHALGRLDRIKVLFKSNVEIRKAPKNVLVVDWLPQNDVLAHPNLRLFITHGGLGGVTEAVYHSVPLLGIPFFADQKGNIASAVNSDYAVRLDINSLTEESLVESIEELWRNPKYAENIKKRSSILRNQPVKPMDNAIWWVEHIMEHGGGEHLRNAGMDLEWYQLYMVDIMAFYLLVASITVTLSFFVSKWILFRLCRLVGVPKEKKSKKKTN